MARASERVRAACLVAWMALFVLEGRTLAQAELLFDIFPGTHGSSPSWTYVLNDEILFWAEDPQSGNTLRAMDGFSHRTIPGGAPGELVFVPYLGQLDSLLFMRLRQPPLTEYEHDLWVTDGDSAWRIYGISQSEGVGAPFDDRFYFAGEDSLFGAELWATDGDAAYLVSDIRPGPESSDPVLLTSTGNILLFFADDGIHGRELWAFDGESARLVHDINPGPEPSSTYALGRAFGGWLYFGADDGVRGQEFWRSNGLQTELVQAGWSPNWFIDAFENLYFPGPDGLWRLEGDTVHQVFESPVGAYNYRAFGDGFAFVTNYPNGDHGFWYWDGDELRLVTQLCLGCADEQEPGNLTVFGDMLYFSGSDGEHGLELWASDGFEASLLMDILPGGASSRPTCFFHS